MGFNDIFHSVKEKENSDCLQHISMFFKKLDEIGDERLLVKALLNNMLAGNMHDW